MAGRALNRLSGSEIVHGPGAPEDPASVLHFWQWAFSDLADNTLRGIFAEWLVGRLLGDTSSVRVGWASHDVTLPSGGSVEVKSAAYRQSWHLDGQSAASRIGFSRLRSRTWDPVAGYALERTHNADVYVLCVQKARAIAEYNALDLGQWEFYVVPARSLDGRLDRSMSLSMVLNLVKAGRATYCADASSLRAAVELESERAS